MRLMVILLLCFYSCSTIPKMSSDAVIIDAEIDDFSNVYTLWNTNELRLYDSSLKEKFVFSDNVGIIKAIDVSNPQKLLLFLENQSQIIFLDNTLSAINKLQIDIGKYSDVTAVALSNDNNIWLWDNQQKALVKINENGQELFRVDLITLLEVGDVNKLLEVGNYLYLLSDDFVYIFTNLGVFENKVNIEDSYNFNFIKSGFSYIKNGKLIIVNLPLLEPKVSDVEIHEGVKVFYENKILVNKSGLSKIN